MRIHRLALYFLLFFVTFNKAFGFVPILELGDDTSAASAASFSSKPLYSRPLSDLEQQEVKEIYDTIFMQYGCPMLLHTYPLLPEAEQRGVIAALSREFGAQELIRERVNSRYPGKYRVRFVPETIFQMGAILQIGELAIRGNNGDFRAEQYFAELINTEAFSSFPGREDQLGSFSQLLISNFPDTGVIPAERIKRLTIFMKKTYGKVNSFPQVRNLYFFVCNLLSSKFGRELEDLDAYASQSNFKKHKKEARERIEYMGKTLVEDYSALANRFDFALRHFASEYCRDVFWYGVDNDGLPWPYKVERHGGNLMLNTEQLSFLLRAAYEEYVSARNGNILLWRGENTTQITLQKVVGDQSTIDQCKVFGCIDRTLGARLTEAQVGVQKTIRVVTGIITVPVPSENDKPYSESFSNALLDGSFQEQTTLRGGARTLDYLYFADGIYHIALPLGDLLNHTHNPLFRISTQNVLARLVSAGEFFHSRSLFDRRNYPIDTYIGGIGGKRRDVSEKDMGTNLGYLCSMSQVDKETSTLGKIMTIDLASIMRNPLSFQERNAPTTIDPDRYAEYNKPTSLQLLLSEENEDVDNFWKPYVNLANILREPQATSVLPIDSSISDIAAPVEMSGELQPTSVLPIDPSIPDIARQQEVRDSLVRVNSILQYGDNHAAVMKELLNSFDRESPKAESNMIDNILSAAAAEA